tara:strand:+ start:1205 stop:2620 length:1416 start_codon:yes stop_codon:yes gene_type:complete
MKEIDYRQEAKEILNRQKQLQEARKKVSHLLDKNIFVVSGDFDTREELSDHFKTLGFSPEHITATNTTAEIINKIKQHIGGIDLIICHFKVLDISASSQTGFQLLKIVKEMLLKVGYSETIPFIFMEKSFEKKEVISALKAGASQLLIVPADPISLSNKLAEVFRKPEDSPISQEIMTLLYKANKLRDQGLFEKAIVLYNKGLAIGGENVEIITEKADAYFEMGDIEQAIQLYKQALEIKSTFPRAYQGLGKSYELMGDLKEARKNYLKVLELEPHNVQIHYNVGILCRKEGYYDKAKDFFNKGIALNKKFINNYLGLAKNYEEEGNPSESIKVLKQALNRNPNQTFLYLSAGDFCLKHNLFQEAETLFTSAININEDHIHLYNKLGIALRKQRKYDKAIKNYTKAIKIKPEDASLYYNQAKAYFFDGEELVSISILNKAFKIDPDLIIEFQKDKDFSKLFVEHSDKFKMQ